MFRRTLQLKSSWVGGATPPIPPPMPYWSDSEVTPSGKVAHDCGPLPPSLGWSQCQRIRGAGLYPVHTCRRRSGLHPEVRGRCTSTVKSLSTPRISTSLVSRGRGRRTWTEPFLLGYAQPPRFFRQSPTWWCGHCTRQAWTTSFIIWMTFSSWLQRVRPCPGSRLAGAGVPGSASGSAQDGVCIVFLGILIDAGCGCHLRRSRAHSLLVHCLDND